MAGNGTIALSAVPQDITGEDFAALAFQVQGAPAKLMATSGTDAPGTDGGILYGPTQGETSAADLASLFPHVGGIQRIWAWNADGEFQAQIFRSWN